MSIADEIRKLAELRDAGQITEAEYLNAKTRLLSGSTSPTVSGFGTGQDNSLNRFRRSTQDRWLGGVCGGLAKLTGVDGWVWRLLFVISVFFAGFGILPYVLLWIFVPSEDQL